ncbi:MAG: prepilin-type N-terminal cleavage/methylation domain-containing protein [Candidatus Margulisiibacteriota bacterium]
MKIKGYSLIELVVVLSIIGIIAGFISFQFSGMTDQIKLQSSIKQIAADLRSAQMRAISEHNDQEIVFSGGRYIVNGKERALPSSVLVVPQISIRFSPSGMPQPGYFGTIRLVCHGRANSIIISNVGRVRVE